MSDQLGIEFIEVGKDYLKARMPVDKRTCQPFGMLHGGATCVLAETIGSIASLMSVNLKQKYAVGSVISANHLRSVISGHVEATCTAIHIGRQKHVWRILVHSDKGKLSPHANSLARLLINSRAIIAPLTCYDWLLIFLCWRP